MFSKSAIAGRSLFARAIVLVLSCVALLAHAASNVVDYTFDAAGNIKQIQRRVAPGFAVTRQAFCAIDPE